VWDPAAEVRAADKASEIIARVEKAGFRILRRRLVHLSKPEAEEFYREHAGKHFFDRLTGFMSSGPTLALELEKEGAIAEWRALMGPTNATAARAAAEAEHPLNEELWSLRALYGSDGTRNATHGSDSATSAARELEYFFPAPGGWERTVAVVTPAAAAAGATDAVVAALEAADFLVLARKATPVAADLAAALAGGDAGVADVLAGGPCEVVVAERAGAVARLRALAGPPPSLAVTAAPSSLHARHGTSDSEVGVVAAPSAAVAAAAIDALFAPGLPLQTTLALIKPGIADSSYAAIIAAIKAAGFAVVAEARRTLSREEAEAFYAEHAGKPFFNGLATYMASGPLVALALAKPAAIKAWRSLMGPTATETARREKPTSMRARFGVDGTRNATHGSDSAASAARELRFFFPTMVVDEPLAGAAAVAFVKSRVVTHVYDSTRDAIVPKTVESVVVDALAALAAAKPSSNPADAVRWLGQWLVDHNPKHGAVAAPPPPRAHGGPIVVEPDDEPAAPLPRAGRQAAALRGGGGAAAAAAATVAPPEASGEGAAGRPATRTIVFVLGGPGSGKGTQCARLATEFGYRHLSTGDIMRAEVASGSELGKRLAATMASGGLVSDDVALTMLKAAMDKAGATRFLIDGYPRSLAQAVEFERVIGAPTFVVAFEASEAVLEARLLARGATSGRADDASVTAIRARFKTFVDQSAPVIDFYDKLGLVRRINSETTPDAVYAATAPHFRPQMVWVLGGPRAGATSVSTALAATPLGYARLALGELVEAEVASGSPLGVRLAAVAERGDVPSTADVVTLVTEAVARAGPTGRYLLDALPRNGEDALALEAAFGRPHAVLHLAASDSLLGARAAAAAGPAAPAARVSAVRAAAAKHAAYFHRHLDATLAALAAGQLVTTLDASLPLATVVADARAALTPTFVFVVGGPGVGKGTQVARIAATFGYTPVAAGDLLRAEVARRSPHGAAIQACLDAGRLVPMDITIGLLTRAMAASRARRLLIDGFPRDVPQAAAFEAALGAPAFVLFFDAPEAVLTERLLHRAATSGRSDDNAAAIAKRFVTYREQSVPVIARYAPRGKVHTIDARPSPDAVFDAVRPLFARRIVLAAGAPGAGKSTGAGALAADFGFAAISTGELARGEVARGTPVGDAIKATLEDGGVVDDATTLALLGGALDAARAHTVVLDGFPLSLAQDDAMHARFGAPAVVLQFELPRDAAKARVLARGKATGRADDRESVIGTRVAAWEEGAGPVLARYAAAKLTRLIDTAPAPAVVRAALRSHFVGLVAVVVGTRGSGRAELAVRAGRELGYATLKVSELLAAEVARGSPAGAAIAEAMAAKRTAPVDITVELIASALAASGARRVLLDGFPRVVSVGYPAVHDQVWALEARLGPIKGCVALTASMAARTARTGAATPGALAALADKVQTYAREKAPVLDFFRKIGKAVDIDTTTASPEAVFEGARPFLQ